MFKECLIAYNLCCKFFIGSGPEMYDTLEVEEFGSFLRNSRNLSLKIHVPTYLSIYLPTNLSSKGKTAFKILSSEIFTLTHELETMIS